MTHILIAAALLMSLSICYAAYYRITKARKAAEVEALAAKRARLARRNRIATGERPVAVVKAKKRGFGSR